MSASSTWLISIEERRSRSRPGVAPASRTSRGRSIAGGAVAVAAEVDAGEDDLAVALRDAAADLAEHGLGGAAARGAAHERDDAEVARERAAVLHLDEGAHAIEPRIRLDAADRADVAGDERRRLLAAARDDDDVVRQAGERVAGEVRAAAGDVDAAVRARRACRLLARLRDRLVRDAARVDDRDVGAAVALRRGRRRAAARAPRARRRARPCSRGSGRRTSSRPAIRAGPQPSRRGRAARAGASRRRAARRARDSRT